MTEIIADRPGQFEPNRTFNAAAIQTLLIVCPSAATSSRLASRHSAYIGTTTQCLELHFGCCQFP
jgi:hypothetical protein